jgi:cell division protein FtsI/penicillin-binding protein 2
MNIILFLFLLLGEDIEKIKKEIKDEGAFIIADIKTGKIIDYHNERLCFGTLIPPGSVFKILTAIIAIEENIISENTYFDCKGEEFIKIGDESVKVKCWLKKGHGKQNIRDAIANSCNIFFAKLSLKIDPFLFKKYFEILKLNELSTLDAPSEVLNEITIPNEKKYLIDLALGENAFVKMTLCGILNLLISISRDGIFIPLWIKEKGSFSSTLPIYKSLGILKEGLREACVRGTGIYANFKNKVAGKTGTPKHLNGWRTYAIFVGYYPYDDPRIGIIVFLKKGQGSKDAAPLAYKILKSLD